MVAMLPAWTATLDTAIAAGGQIRLWCSSCRQNRDVDLVALRDRVGGSYSLRNRRCRCRLTPGCPGWNEFDYLNGVFRPLREIEVVERRLRRFHSAVGA